MTAEKDFEVDKLMSEWLSDDGPSLSRVKSQVRKALIRSRVLLLIEFGVALAGLMAGLILANAGDGLIGAGAIAFSVFGGGAAVYARGRSWRVSINAVSDEVEVLEREVRTMQRAGWAGLTVCIAAMVFLAIVFVDGSENFIGERSLTALVIALLFILFSAAISIRMSMNARQRADKLRAARHMIRRRE